MLWLNWRFLLTGQKDFVLWVGSYFIEPLSSCGNYEGLGWLNGETCIVGVSFLLATAAPCYLLLAVFRFLWPHPVSSLRRCRVSVRDVESYEGRHVKSRFPLSLSAVTLLPCKSVKAVRVRGVFQLEADWWSYRPYRMVPFIRFTTIISRCKSGNHI